MNWTADRDEPGKLASGVLAVAVHIAFFALLVLGVSWQHRTPDTVEIELWNNLPPAPQVKTPPPPPPQPKIEPEVKPPPPQPKVEVKPKPEPEPKPVAKPDIALEKEKQEKARREREEKAEAIKREQLAKAEARKRDEAKKAADEKLAALERDRREQEDRVAKLQKEQDEAIRRAQQAQASAQAKMVDEYKRRISDKIRRYVVKDPCAALGNPQIVFEAILLPDGNTLQPPRIKRSSGSAACDDAVLRAVIRAQPLPLPPDPVLVAQFRELNLDFRPNE